MSATVTIKVSPSEFDLIRVALESHKDEAYKMGMDKTLPADVRHRARELTVRLADLIAKMA